MSRFGRFSLYFAIAALLVTSQPMGANFYDVLFDARLSDQPFSYWPVLLSVGFYLVPAAVAIVLLAVTLWRDRKRPTTNSPP